MPPPDLSAVPTTELIETLRTSGYDVPKGLPEEIARRAGEAIEPLCALVRDDALWKALDPRGYMAPIHAVHLLGAIGDAAVAPVLVEVVKTRDLGDFLTEDAPSILAALAPAAIAPLMDAAEDGSLDMYQRHALAHGLYGIAARSPERRAEAAAFFARLLREADSELVSLLIEDAARIGDTGAQAAIDTVFDEGRVFEGFICRSDVERIRREPRWQIPRDLEDPMTYFHSGELESMKQRWEARQRREAERATQVERASPMPSAREPRQRTWFAGATQAKPASPVPKGPKVGRNDPCPCGSGKKYKKCCLR